MPESVYRVLARKYRPQRFDDLIGQDVLVRTLTNAFSSGRIAHAFLLTGIRGIGKTTTARIIARGLNCIGPDGTGGATTDPCGVCPNCKMILEDRHVDVIEMDAASRTGVDDIRDIIETVHYAPTSARYKIYIIDEVHMLSKNAFNALLKTLEEPPAHVKFIFATTELRKIPITIVSRCQRFDLRRLDVDMLSEHLNNICEKESVKTDTESMQLVSTAAEGSVRDALSLLDQAISMGTDAEGNVTIEESTVRDMLGMADKTRSFALLEHSFKGEAKEAIDILRESYARGSDPLLMLQDLLEITHYITRIKLASGLSENVHYSDIEQQKAKALSESLSMTALTRGWQMILKGIQEVKLAPHPLAASEMILIRLSHSANLPTPEEIIKQLESNSGNANHNAPASIPTGAASSGGAPVASAVSQSTIAPAAVPSSATSGNLALALNQQPEMQPELVTAQPEEQAEPEDAPESFADLLELLNNEPMLYSHIFNDVRPISIAPGVITVRPVNHVPSDFAARVSRAVSDACGSQWVLRFSDEEGEPTLREQEAAAERQRIAYATAHPHVQKALNTFPGAEVIRVDVVEETDQEEEES